MLPCRTGSETLVIPICCWSNNSKANYSRKASVDSNLIKWPYSIQISLISSTPIRIKWYNKHKARVHTNKYLQNTFKSNKYGWSIIAQTIIMQIIVIMILQIGMVLSTSISIIHRARMDRIKVQQLVLRIKTYVKMLMDHQETRNIS